MSDAIDVVSMVMNTYPPKYALIVRSDTDFANWIKMTLNDGYGTPRETLILMKIFLFTRVLFGKYRMHPP